MAGCAHCSQPLVLSKQGDGSQPAQEIPDDLTLPCGCHLHWECLIEEAEEVAISLKCPVCQTYLAANQPGPSATNAVWPAMQGVKVPVSYHSEGGVQEDYDILPDLTEEAYLVSHPEALDARAFLTMVQEGDVLGLMDLLSGAPHEDGIDDSALSFNTLLRWQNPLGGNKGALHIAVEEDQEDTFYLLLFLASRLPESAFPRALLVSAQQSGITRPPVCPDPDIRSLRDANGETAEDYARRIGGSWGWLAETGIFSFVDEETK